MTKPTRLEINFTRLLDQCNKMISDGKLEDWRLEKFVGSLEEMLVELKKNSVRPTPDVLKDYSSRVEFLKGIIQADKLPTPAEKVLANQFISPGSNANNRTVTKEIHLKTANRYVNEMRKELLESSGARRRGPYKNPDEVEDYNSILKYHDTVQEKIAEEMITLARNLKENTKLAGTIVRKDTEVLEKSSTIADQNFDRLKIESTRLEKHTTRSCSWWVWIMLAVVCATFMWMIMFMKVFPKSKV